MNNKTSLGVLVVVCLAGVLLYYKIAHQQEKSIESTPTASDVDQTARDLVGGLH
jgi:hypothetical protein